MENQPIAFEDWYEINRLLMTYAELIDAARWEEASKLFERSTYRVDHAGESRVSTYQGSDAVIGFMRATRVHADGTPRTKHVISNVLVEADEADATSRCYVTVFQQTDRLPLQPIASGRYLDRFVRDGGQWRFSDRLITGFLLGDRSDHIDWAES